MPTAPYYVEKKRVPGVTTVIGRFKESGGLIHWAWNLGIEGKDYRQERDAAASAGTLAHDMIEAEILGQEFKPPEDTEQETIAKAEAGFDAYQMWAAQSKVEVLETEMHLVSEQYRFGGTPDAVGMVNGELCLIDWKTSNALYADYLIQVAAYVALWNENRPEDKITGGVHVCRFSKDYADFEHRYFSDLVQPWEAFKLMRQLYDMMATLKKRVR